MFIPFLQPNDWYGVVNVVVADHLVGSDGLLRFKCRSTSGNVLLSSLSAVERRYKNNVACKVAVLEGMAVRTGSPKRGRQALNVII